MQPGFGYPRALAAGALLLAQLGLGGCGILFGNVRPGEEKAQDYGVMDLSKSNPDWARLDSTSSAAKDPEASAKGISDIAYQSKRNASIISLNSACHSAEILSIGSGPASPQDLKGFTNQLLLGITDITLRNEKPVEVREIPALQTTVKGKLNSESVMLRTVVLKRQDYCIYDLMYVSRPERFAENEQDFSAFVASLDIK